MERREVQDRAMVMLEDNRLGAFDELEDTPSLNELTAGTER